MDSVESVRKARIMNEVGVMAYVNYGEDYGKQVTIVNSVNNYCVLVEGDNFPRVLFPREKLTKSKI